MPDYYDPITRKWSFDSGNDGWHWPWVFLLTAFGLVGAVIALGAIVTGLL